MSNPTDTLPGTKARLAVMQGRAALGLPLQAAGDVIHDPARKPVRKRLRNGRDREIEPATEEEAREAREAQERILEQIDDGEKVLKEFNTMSADKVRPVFLGGIDPDRVTGNLRWLRRRKGSSLGQVAAATGLDRSTVLYLEQGRTKDPRLAALWALADYYHVTLDDLVGRLKR